MVKTRIKAADFEDRLTLVEHLDELRNRIIVSGIVLVLAVVVCFIFNDAILDIANHPLPNSSAQLITLSPTEPFLTTLTLVLYAALIVTMPVLLYQIYAFILPALSPEERKVAVPLMLMVPVLFILGVLFAYFVVVPAAVKFLLNFNDDQFNIQIRAREYYSFFALSLLSVGVLFQIPVGILAVTRLGITTPEALAKNRRYAILVIAVAAMLLPGTDPITMLISMVPLLILFEFSLVLARWFNRNVPSSSPDETTRTATNRRRTGRRTRRRDLVGSSHAFRPSGEAQARRAGDLPGPRPAHGRRPGRPRHRRQRQRRHLRRARDRRQQHLERPAVRRGDRPGQREARVQPEGSGSPAHPRSLRVPRGPAVGFDRSRHPRVHAVV